MPIGSETMKEKARGSKEHVEAFRDVLDEDRRIETRRQMAEMADAMTLTLTTLSNFLELSDDVGAIYVVRRLMAYASALQAAALILHKALPGEGGE
jgi:hypothetical protein